MATTSSETSPLLDDPSLEAQQTARVTPLPKLQLAALCMSRLSDPVAFTQVFPYINEFLASLHVADDDPSRIGIYSGIVESSYAIVQLCSIFQWVKLSNIVGRRPVIVCGPIGLALTTLCFGLSKTYVQVLVSRCLGGIFSGNAAVVLSALGELTDSTNQASAFPIFGLCWPLGGIIGPLIGGALARPADRFPNFLDIPFMRQHPYFLPCLITSLIAFVAFMTAYFFLDETLPRERAKIQHDEHGTSGEYRAIKPEHDRNLSMRELLAIPIIRALCTSGFALSFSATAFDVVFALFCYTPIRSGGLGFSTSQIGYPLAVAGVISTFIQIAFLPSLLRTFDNAKLYNFCMALWPFAFAVLPFLNSIAVIGVDPYTGTIDPYASVPLWVGIGLALSIARISCLAFSVNMILIRNNVPNPSSLGATNGLVHLSMCLSRAFAPAIVSAAFSWSLKRNILGGHMWVLLMILVSIIGYTISKKIIYYSLIQ